jgi:hypothetical protein
MGKVECGASYGRRAFPCAGPLLYTPTEQLHIIQFYIFNVFYYLFLSSSLRASNGALAQNYTKKGTLHKNRSLTLHFMKPAQPFGWRIARVEWISFFLSFIQRLGPSFLANFIFICLLYSYCRKLNFSLSRVHLLAALLRLLRTAEREICIILVSIYRRHALCSAEGNLVKKSLNPWYITGFTDAEGCFSISIAKSKKNKTGWQINASFSLHLHSKDISLLESIKDYFSVGNVYQEKMTESVSYKVTSIIDLMNVIIPHFDKHPLISQKRVDYLAPRLKGGYSNFS